MPSRTPMPLARHAPVSGAGTIRVQAPDDTAVRHLHRRLPPLHRGILRQGFSLLRKHALQSQQALCCSDSLRPVTRHIVTRQRLRRRVVPHQSEALRGHRHGAWRVWVWLGRSKDI